MRDRDLSPVVTMIVTAMTASRRIRRAVLIIAVLVIVSGGVMGFVLFRQGANQHLFLAYLIVLVGCGLLFWWLVACVLAWMARIVAQDVRDEVRRSDLDHLDR